MLNDLKYVLLDEKQIEEITDRLAAEIDRDYADTSRPLVLVCILKGAVVFFGDLLKKIHRPVELEFMKVSSYYSGTTSTGQIYVHLDLKRTDFAACDFLIIEDIVDSGRTLSMLMQLFRERHAHSIDCCVLLDKVSRREVPCVPRYRGAEIPDEFVVGYGLDYDERYRNLPIVGVLKPEIYSKS